MFNNLRVGESDERVQVNTPEDEVLRISSSNSQGSSLLISGKLTGFCVLTSVSSALSLLGTCFLSGPVNQLRKMFDSNRWLASLCYIGSITIAIIAGLVLKNPPLAIIFVVLQYVAMAWYSLSYIPHARQFIARFLCSCL